MAWFGELRERLRHRGDDLVCRMIVELVTDYLDGAMDDVARMRFERHLDTCGDCTAYVEQVKATARMLGEVLPVPPDGATRDALIDAFRDFDRA